MSTRGLWLAVSCKWVRTGVRNCSGINNIAARQGSSRVDQRKQTRKIGNFLSLKWNKTSFVYAKKATFRSLFWMDTITLWYILYFLHTSILKKGDWAKMDPLSLYGNPWEHQSEFSPPPPPPGGGTRLLNWIGGCRWGGGGQNMTLS